MTLKRSGKGLEFLLPNFTGLFCRKCIGLDFVLPELYWIGLYFAETIPD